MRQCVAAGRRDGLWRATIHTRLRIVGYENVIMIEVEVEAAAGVACVSSGTKTAGADNVKRVTKNNLQRRTMARHKNCPLSSAAMHSRHALQCFCHTRSSCNLLSLAGWSAASARVNASLNAAFFDNHAHHANVSRSWPYGAALALMPPATPQQPRRTLQSWALRWHGASQQPSEDDTTPLQTSGDEEVEGASGEQRFKAGCASQQAMASQQHQGASLWCVV